MVKNKEIGERKKSSIENRWRNFFIWFSSSPSLTRNETFALMALHHKRLENWLKIKFSMVEVFLFCHNEENWKSFNWFSSSLFLWCCPKKRFCERQPDRIFVRYGRSQTKNCARTKTLGRLKKADGKSDRRQSPCTILRNWVRTDSNI